MINKGADIDSHFEAIKVVTISKIDGIILRENEKS